MIDKFLKLIKGGEGLIEEAAERQAKSPSDVLRRALAR